MAFPVWWYEHYCQPEFGLTAIQNIAELGADWVQLVPTWYQEDRNAIEVMRVEDKTATDECLTLAIGAAHNNGLKVMLKPHVDSLDGYFRVLLLMGKHQKVLNLVDNNLSGTPADTLPLLRKAER